MKSSSSDSESSMECRICFEGENLLTDLCKCKGTQGFIHAVCLQRWIRMRQCWNCSVCGESFRVENRLVPTRPYLWSVLGNPMFEYGVHLTILLTSVYGGSLVQDWSRFVKNCLHILYAVAYAPILYHSMSWVYLIEWLRPMYVLDRRIYFPLPTLFAVYLLHLNPFFLFVLYPYTNLWSIHLHIQAKLYHIVE